MLFFALNTHQTIADSLFLSVSWYDLSAGSGNPQCWAKKAKTSLFEEVQHFLQMKINMSTLKIKWGYWPYVEREEVLIIFTCSYGFSSVAQCGGSVSSWYGSGSRMWKILLQIRIQGELSYRSVLWIQIDWIWIRIQDFGRIWIRIQGDWYAINVEEFFFFREKQLSLKTFLINCRNKMCPKEIFC